MHDDDRDEIDELRDLTPAKALRERYTLESRLSAPGSTSGIIADRLRQGLAARDGYQGDGGQQVRARLADRLILMRDLSDAEQLACCIRYSGVSGHTACERVIEVSV